MAPLDFLDHGGNRLFPEHLVGTGHVDQVRRMGDRLHDARLIECRAEGAGVLVGERRCLPLVVILGKKLHGLETHRMRRTDRPITSAGD